jgi:hypothetical protein
MNIDFDEHNRARIWARLRIRHGSGWTLTKKPASGRTADWAISSVFGFVYEVKVEQYSHCSRVHIVRRIALKPILLDFWGRVLSSNDIESVKNIPQKVLANEHKIFGFR